MIAMALMCSPRLVIADEPTTALDVTVQLGILKLIRELQSEMGLAMLFVSHDLGVMANVTDRMMLMYAGQIVESGRTTEVLRRPAHPYTSALINCRPTLGHNARTGRLAVIPGRVPQLKGNLQGCQFRNRCAFALEACASDEPLLDRSRAGHDVRCLRANDPPLLHGLTQAGSAP
jgi:peptide/nickel transport system ATP-binding protein